MKIHVSIDEGLWEKAKQLTGADNPEAFINQLIEKEIRLREAQSRLIAAGGTMPNTQLPIRDRHLTHN